MTISQQINEVFEKLDNSPTAQVITEGLAILIKLAKKGLEKEQAEEELLVCAEEARKRLGNVSKASLHRFMNQRGLPSQGEGHKRRFRVKDLESFIRGEPFQD